MTRSGSVPIAPSSTAGPTPVSAAGQSITPAAVRAELARKGQGHQHTLSTSPRSTPALSDPDYWPDRDGEDDVFSNPDTAELEARSDATGATSPDRAVSPIVGSPDLTSAASLLARARAAGDEELKRNEIPSQQGLDDPASAVATTARESNTASLPRNTLQHQPSEGSQLTQATATRHSRANDTPTPSMLNARLSNSRPHSAGQGSIHHDSTIGNNWQLPAANELPQDPSEASHVSSLFVHPPAPPSALASHGSPTASSLRLALSGASAASVLGSPVASTSASAAGSPLSERAGFQWTSTMSGSSPVMRSAAPRAAVRPRSPDRQRTVMPSISNTADGSTTFKAHKSSNSSITSGLPSPASPSSSSRRDSAIGLGFPHSLPGVTAAQRSHSPSHVVPPSPAQSRVVSGHSMAHSESVASLATTESSIFERDIEHRDARHVLTKSEAIDVAIPPVLDDAMEAIVESEDTPLEIVEPIPAASPAPAALSAVALTAHAMASTGSALESPLAQSSPPLSQVGPSGPAPGEAPPLGSIAAQIAEKLAPSPRAVDEQSAAMSVEGRSGHRAAHSSSASSVSSSMRSWSPGSAAPIGVQQVLDGSGVLDSSGGNPQGSSRPSHGREIGTAASQGLSAPSSAASPVTPSRPSSQSFGTALPSLPLPNPFRSDSPSVLKHSHSSSMSSSSEPHGPAAPMSMSLDGAVIPSAESAIRELSLDGMADALVGASDPPSSETQEGDMPSPILPRKATLGSAKTTHSSASRSSLPPSAASPVPSGLGLFGRRDTDMTITPLQAAAADEGLKGANALADVSESMPGGLPADAATSAVGRASNPASANASPRRLSFFSYADIINETPAEVVDLESSIQKKTAEDALATLKASATPSAQRVGHMGLSDVSVPSTPVTKQSSIRSGTGNVHQQSSQPSRGDRIVSRTAPSATDMGRSTSAGPASPSAK